MPRFTLSYLKWNGIDFRRVLKGYISVESNPESVRMRNLQLDESLVGTVIDGGFLITQFLGAGGMGAAFRAKQAELNRDVCVKFLREDGLTDPENLARFKREARVLSRLRHNNIVGCYSFGLLGSVFPFLVMEYLEGRSLKHLLNEERLGWAPAVSIVEQICNGLEYAHQSGFVHRDIKPDNIMLPQSGTQDISDAKIIDFGLVGKHHGPVDVDTLTSPGTLIGSVNYMAPEAFRGEPANRSLDIYSVGCVLFELLSGRQPFEADNPMAVMYKHVNEQLPPLPKDAAPDTVRGTLEELIWTATATDPAMRFDSCGEIAVVLRDVLLHHADPDTKRRLQRRLPLSPRTPPSVRRAAICLAGIAAFAACILASQTLSRKQEAVNSPGLTLASQRFPVEALAPELTSEQQQSYEVNVRKRLQAFDLSLQGLIASWSRRERHTASFATASTAGFDRNPRAVEDRTTGALVANTKNLLSALQEFLRRDGYYLDAVGESTADGVRALTRRLSELCIDLSRAKQASLANEFIDFQCDLCSSSAFYQEARSILDTRKPLPEGATLDQPRAGLSNFLEHCVALKREASGTDEDIWIWHRLRPLVRHFSQLTNGANYFVAYVAQYSTEDETWVPSLFQVYQSLRFRNVSSRLQALSGLSALYLNQHQTDKAAQVLQETLRYYQLSSNFQINELADALFDIHQSDTAVSILNAESAKAKLRNDPFRYCCAQSQLAKFAIELKRSKGLNYWNEFLQNDEWSRVYSEWRQPPSPSAGCENTVYHVLACLEQSANLLSYHDRAGSAELFRHLRELVLAGKRSGLSYAMTLYHAVRYHSYAKFFVESLDLARALNEACYQPNLEFTDKFFYYAADVELGQRLLLVGKKNEARTYLTRAASIADELISNPATGGTLPYVEESIEFFRAAGLNAEAEKIRQLLVEHSLHPFGGAATGAVGSPARGHK